MIDNYDILRPIGKGKFAVVYRAKRKVDEEICKSDRTDFLMNHVIVLYFCTFSTIIVALKKIKIDMMDRKAIGKCLNEVKLLQSLDHENIIRYMEYFLSEEDLTIIVEWAAAGDLKRQLRKVSYI